MNQDLCVRGGQEGPNFSYIVQVVEGDLGNFFDVLIKGECRIKVTPRFLTVEL